MGSLGSLGFREFRVASAGHDTGNAKLASMHLIGFFSFLVPAVQVRPLGFPTLNPKP